MSAQSEKLLGSLNEITAALVDAAKSAIELGREQLPLICEEMLRYGVAVHWVWIVAFCAVMFLGIMVIVIFKDSGVTVGGWVIFIAILGIASNARWLFKIYLAPRLYLLGEMKGLIE